MRFAALFCVAILAGCGGSVHATDPPENVTSTVTTAPPDDVAVLPAAAIPTILQQCSRQAPAVGEGGWRPGTADIAALEAAAAVALRKRRVTNDPDWSRFPQAWRRQYVGITRGGRRFIYGNVFPGDAGNAGDPDQWRREPMIVCDGGPAFFGVEYDVEGRRITQLAFNGSA